MGPLSVTWPERAGSPSHLSESARWGHSAVLKAAPQALFKACFSSQRTPSWVTSLILGFRYSRCMPWGLERYQRAGDLHFVTFSCYRRLPFLQTPSAKRRVEWSSFRHYATGCASPVELESPWTDMARRRVGMGLHAKVVARQWFGERTAESMEAPDGAC